MYELKTLESPFIEPRPAMPQSSMSPFVVLIDFSVIAATRQTCRLSPEQVRLPALRSQGSLRATLASFQSCASSASRIFSARHRFLGVYQASFGIDIGSATRT